MKTPDEILFEHLPNIDREFNEEECYKKIIESHKKYAEQMAVEFEKFIRKRGNEKKNYKMFIAELNKV